MGYAHITYPPPTHTTTTIPYHTIGQPTATGQHTTTTRMNDHSLNQHATPNERSFITDNPIPGSSHFDTLGVHPFSTPWLKKTAGPTHATPGETHAYQGFQAFPHCCNGLGYCPRGPRFLCVHAGGRPNVRTRTIPATPGLPLLTSFGCRDVPGNPWMSRQLLYLVV